MFDRSQVKLDQMQIALRERSNGFVRQEHDHGMWVRQNAGQAILSCSSLVYDEFLFACGHVAPARFSSHGEGPKAEARCYEQASRAERFDCCPRCQKEQWLANRKDA